MTWWLNSGLALVRAFTNHSAWFLSRVHASCVADYRSQTAASVAGCIPAAPSRSAHAHPLAGAVGLFAAALGAHVVLTDTSSFPSQRDIFELMRRNIESNRRRRLPAVVELAHPSQRFTFRYISNKLPTSTISKLTALMPCPRQHHFSVPANLLAELLMQPVARCAAWS